jgi:hypothetical protein
VRASWIGVITGFSLVAYAFAGTISLNPSILGVRALECAACSQATLPHYQVVLVSS